MQPNCTAYPQHDGIPARASPTDESNPVFKPGHGTACILCARCVNACQSGHPVHRCHRRAWAPARRLVSPPPPGDKPLGESICTTCGQCLSVCPTGAISVKDPADTTAPTRQVKTTCPYCGVGCGIKLEVNDATDGPDAGTHHRLAR